MISRLQIVSKTHFFLSFYKKVSKKFGRLKYYIYFCSRKKYKSRNMMCIQNNYWWWRSRD